MAYESWISHTLQRPYPYRWATPAAVVGALFVVIIFSLVNFASSGYQLVSIYSNNPNVTITEHSLSGFSFLQGNIRPSCEPASIPINTVLVTNNTALQYTLTNVRDAKGKQSPSLVYFNHELQNCEIESVELQLQSAPGRTGAQFWLSQWGIDAQAHVACRVPSPNGPGYNSVNLLMDYNFIPNTVFMSSGQYEFLGRNAEDAASLYWGESLLTMYYFWFMVGMNNATAESAESRDSNPEAPWIAVTFRFTKSGLTNDITSLDYHRTRFRAVEPTMSYNNKTGQSDPYTFKTIYFDKDIRNPTVGEVLAAEYDPPNVFIAADSMAKAIESTILTDLGQKNTSLPNILTDPALLQYFTSNFSQMIAFASVDSSYALLNLTGGRDAPQMVGPAIDDYATLKNVTGPLEVHSSTMAYNYLCSIPRRKSLGDLLISLTVADLVFLKTGWLIFTLALSFCFRKQGPKADFCQGCMKHIGHEDHEMLLPTSIRPSAGYSILDGQDSIRTMVNSAASSRSPSPAASKVDELRKGLLHV